MIDVFAARSSHATAGLSQCDRARQRLFMVRLRTRLALRSISDDLTIGFSYGGGTKNQACSAGAVADSAPYFCLPMQLPPRQFVRRWGRCLSLK